MKIDVYDSFATSTNGELLHFDVLVERGTSKEEALKFGQAFLSDIGEDPGGLDLARCNYCHSENANSKIEDAIHETGFFILQMEGCPNPVA